MGNKIRVYGKAQNRTALGIMHAYLIMHPHATLEDLKKAFPDNLNPDCGVKRIFVDMKEIDVVQGSNWNGFFSEDECLLKLQDGRKIAVVSMWTKSSFDKLVDWAKQYDIEIAKFEVAEKGIGKKGGYRLEYLNGYVPPVPEKKKNNNLIWIILGAVAVIILLIILLFTRNGKDAQVVKIIEKEPVTIIKTDTVYIKQFQEIEEQFNAAQFAKDSYELNEDAKLVLYNLVKLMEKNPDINLKIVGHTSSEGDYNHNLELSKNRAKAAVDYLISKGISKNRLSFEGKGSTEPIDTNNNEKNRRTEFIIIE